MMKRRSTSASSEYDSNEDELLEIKPPQPKIRKYGSSAPKYPERRDRHHKHSSVGHGYSTSSASSSGYYKSGSHTAVNRYETHRRHQSSHRHEPGKEVAHSSIRDYPESSRDVYQKNKHHQSHHHHRHHHRSYENRKETKSREDRYFEEEEQALKDKLKRNEEDLMRSKIEKRRHHQRNNRKENEKGGSCDNDSKNDNKFIQADRLREVYQKESEERMKKHEKEHKQTVEVVKDKSTPPRAYDTDHGLASIVVVSDETENDSDDEDKSETPLSSGVSVSSSVELTENVEVIPDDEERTEKGIDENADRHKVENSSSSGNDNSSSENSSSADEDSNDDDDNDDDNDDDSSSQSGSSSSSFEDGTSSSTSSSSALSSSFSGREEEINGHHRIPHHQRNGHSVDETLSETNGLKEDRRRKKKHEKDTNGYKNDNSNEDIHFPDRSSEDVATEGSVNLQEEEQQQQQLGIEAIIKNYFPGIQGCRSVEQFHCLNKIEEGTYGIVYRARDKRTNQIVALKRLKMEKEKEGFPITSLREINTLLKAQHPNIVTVREIVVGSNMDKIFIVMDYVEHDLKSLMETMKQRKSSFIPSEVKCLMTQLLMAVDHLHDNWILHRDLKTSNLLFSHQGILKVGDFGLAREYGSPLKHYTSVVVTLWYRAPELLLGTRLYSTAIDMWSIGCIFAELVLMEPLFTGKSEADQINRIFKALGTPTEQQWPDFRKMPVVQRVTFSSYPNNVLRNKITPNLLPDLGYDLLMKLLTYDPKERISAQAALNHEYFKTHPLAIDPAMFPTWPAKSEPGYSTKLKMESPKAPSGGQGYKDLGDDEGFFIAERSRNTAAAFNSSFCLKF